MSKHRDAGNKIAKAVTGKGNPIAMPLSSKCVEFLRRRPTEEKLRRIVEMIRKS